MDGNDKERSKTPEEIQKEAALPTAFRQFWEITNNH